MAVVVFIVVPILEIVAAAVVANMIGWWSTIGLLFLLSLLGIWQLKAQGLGAWRRVREELRAGRSPAQSLLDGGLRLVGAVLLTLPGFLTAILSLPFFVGPSRRVVAGRAQAWSVGRLRVPFLVVTTVSDAGGTAMRYRRNAQAVDVDGWEVPVDDPRATAPPALPRHDPQP